MGNTIRDMGSTRGIAIALNLLPRLTSGDAQIAIVILGDNASHPFTLHLFVSRLGWDVNRTLVAMGELVEAGVVFDATADGIETVWDEGLLADGTQFA